MNEKIIINKPFWYVKFAIGLLFILKSALYEYALCVGPDNALNSISPMQSYSLILLILTTCFGIFLCFFIKNRVQLYGHKTDKELKSLLLSPLLASLFLVVFVILDRLLWPRGNYVACNVTLYLYSFLQLLAFLFWIAAIVNSYYLTIKQKIVGFVYLFLSMIVVLLFSPSLFLS